MQFKIRVTARVLAVSLAVAALPASAWAASADSLAASVAAKPDSVAHSEQPKPPRASRRRVARSPEGPLFSAHIGPARPAGQFKEIAATGIGEDLSVWLMRRRRAYGARARLAQFGGAGELEP